MTTEDDIDIDTTVYKEYVVLEENRVNCATESCSEYQFVNKTNTREIKGTYAAYPNTGYLIDFDSDRTTNQ